MIVFLCFTFSTFGDEANTCLEKAFTQSEMNNCHGIDFKKADTELNSVYKLIQLAYSDNEEFLIKLKKSQRIWIQLRDANIEMAFPLKDKRYEYGSVYPTCSLGMKTDETLERVEFLKQWLIGIEEGDVCSGSVKRPTDIRDALKK